jgi:hypothetical protein
MPVLAQLHPPRRLLAASALVALLRRWLGPRLQRQQAGAALALLLLHRRWGRRPPRWQAASAVLVVVVLLLLLLRLRPRPHQHLLLRSVALARLRRRLPQRRRPHLVAGVVTEASAVSGAACPRPRLQRHRSASVQARLAAADSVLLPLPPLLLLLLLRFRSVATPPMPRLQPPQPSVALVRLRPHLPQRCQPHLAAGVAAEASAVSEAVRPHLRLRLLRRRLASARARRAVAGLAQVQVLPQAQARVRAAEVGLASVRVAVPVDSVGLPPLLAVLVRAGSRRRELCHSAAQRSGRLAGATGGWARRKQVAQDVVSRNRGGGGNRRLRIRITYCITTSISLTTNKVFLALMLSLRTLIKRRKT